MLKRHGSSAELLPQDVVELILERLPVKYLLRFMSVSNKWKSTIESRHFQEQQFIHRRQSRGPDVLCVSLGFGEGNDRYDDTIGGDDDDNHGDDGDGRIVLGSSIVCTDKVRFPTPNSILCRGSCDGLLCLYCVYTPSVVVNPATRWHQSFPLSNFQQLCLDKLDKQDYDFPNPKLGFGKDKFRGIYKPVWLYNSSGFGLENVTTCEVFDFSTNAWRYLLPASPYKINDFHDPVYLDGSLYWLTLCEETKVLSLDLHSETFQVICKAPFPRGPEPCSSLNVIMCILDNRLCISEKKELTQVIWWLDSSGGNKTWKKLCSIDFTKTVSWFGGEPISPMAPIAIVDEHKLLLQGHHCLELEPLLMHDLHAKSYDLIFQSRGGYPVSYFQSLFSASSN